MQADKGKNEKENIFLIQPGFYCFCDKNWEINDVIFGSAAEMKIKLWTFLWLVALFSPHPPSPLPPDLNLSIVWLSPQSDKK